MVNNFNDNGVRIVNFATSKNPIVKGTMFPQRNINKTYLDVSWWKDIQSDRPYLYRQHSIVLDISSVRGADCDTDHYLVVTNVRERLAVSKRATQKSDMERLNLKQLNEVEGKEQYQVKISHRFTALENLRDVDMDRD
jgi:hypothetical protein